jgi:hypothetical protein
MLQLAVLVSPSLWLARLRSVRLSWDKIPGLVAVFAIRRSHTTHRSSAQPRRLAALGPNSLTSHPNFWLPEGTKPT